MSFTVIGAGGFIGGHLVTRLRRLGRECEGFGRDFCPQPGRAYGDVVYAAGLTADFRHRPFETVDAHVCTLRRLLAHGGFTSLVYLSSTRVYQNCISAHEDERLTVSPSNPSDLYNLSKLMGESLCLAGATPTVRVVRLSNVIDPQFAPTAFLGSVVEDALTRGAVTFQTAPDSAKDYVALEDVLALLPQIAERGAQRTYNLASGTNVTNQQIATLLETELGCPTHFTQGALRQSFPPISIARLRSEFSFEPRDPIKTIRQALSSCRRSTVGLPRAS